MIRTIFHIRLQQLNGLGRGLSPFLMLFIVAVLWLFIMQFYAYAQQANGALYIAVGIFLSLLSIQITRKDKPFLAAILPNYRQWLWIEYLLLCLPFALLLLLAQEYLYSAAVILSCAVLPFIHFSFKKQPNKWLFIKKLLPPSFFEWKAGIQQHGTSLLALYILALGLAWFPFVSLFLAWGLTMLISSFYKECESLTILDTTFTQPLPFLAQKIGKQLVLYSLFITPILGLFTGFHPDQWWIVGLIFFFFALSLVITILAKYSYYTPNTFLNDSHPLLLFISACLIVPFLVPILLLLFPILLYKAHQNLLPYVLTNP